VLPVPTVAIFDGNVVPMKAAATRPYRQRRRAAAAEANTERIIRAALDLFAERPFEQITLNAVAERAGVGVQTVIRRVQTKDGLARAAHAWVAPQVIAERGEPVTDDPQAVAAGLARHYERWGELTDRTLRQADVSPALAENAEAGRRGHREWIATAFVRPLAACAPERRHELLARLSAVCGVELWLVLRRDNALTVDEARRAVADLIEATLSQEH
jgi:AcrR family transcriptional regulator